VWGGGGGGGGWGGGGAGGGGGGVGGEGFENFCPPTHGFNTVCPWGEFPLPQNLGPPPSPRWGGVPLGGPGGVWGWLSGGFRSPTTGEKPFWAWSRGSASFHFAEKGGVEFHLPQGILWVLSQDSKKEGCGIGGLLAAGPNSRGVVEPKRAGLQKINGGETKRILTPKKKVKKQGAFRRGKGRITALCQKKKTRAEALVWGMMVPPGGDRKTFPKLNQKLGTITIQKPMSSQAHPWGREGQGEKNPGSRGEKIRGPASWKRKGSQSRFL